MLADRQNSGEDDSLHTPKLVKVPNPFKPVARIKPTIRHVTEIVPQSVIPKLNPR